MKYRVGEFAALTGVTVRALQHYDRMGLLTPSRTESGHRLYVKEDQQRMRRILALRAVGMPLQRIAEVLAASPERLREVLEEQRIILEQSRVGIEQTIRVLRRLEMDQGDAAGNVLLDRLTSAVEADDVLEAMRGYFSDDAWAKWGEGYFYDWPSPAWRTLFRDIEGALDVEPDSARAQELLARATVLWNADIGSDSTLARAVRQGYGSAWNARDRWPGELRRRYAEFRIEAIATFLSGVAMARLRRDGLMQTYTTGTTAGQEHTPAQPAGQ